MEETKVLTTIEEVKAISDPFRYRILSAFYKLNAPSTVKEVASEMNEVPANIHYHVKKLEASGILKLVYTREIKGIVAKYYEPTAENYQIRYSSELENVNKELVLAEKQRMLSQFYDISKNIFVEQLRCSSERGMDNHGILTMEDLYLNDAEVKEFEEYIAGFVDKHKKRPENMSGIANYHTFISFLKIPGKG